MFQIICAWCGAYKWSDDTWHRDPEFKYTLIEPVISHGICPQCYEEERPT